MKKSKLQQLKDIFYWVDGKPVLEQYGKFRAGLTGEEIKNYLRVRANKLNAEKTFCKFCEIAGANTGALVTCEKCKETFCLTYRHDVERFAAVLFEGKTTYFD